MPSINTSKVDLRTLFSNDFLFCIPHYQRPYSWGKEQCEQLIEDLFEANRENDYFLGTCILQQNGVHGQSTQYEIIDGQQRITTLQILLACLRDLVEDEQYKKPTQDKIYQAANPADGVAETIRLKVRSIDRQFFRDYVQKCGGTNSIGESSPTDSIKQRIKENIIFFKESLINKGQEYIKELILFLSTKCVMIYVSTESFEDAFRLFSITNDRGLQLRKIDILKSFNLNPDYYTDCPDDITRYSQMWESMENDLGANKFEHLLASIRSIYVKEKQRKDLMSEYRERIFNNNHINPGPDFIDNLKRHKDVYQSLILDKNQFDSNNDYNNIIVRYKNLIYLMEKHMPIMEWISPLISYNIKYGNENLWIFLTMLFTVKNTSLHS